MEKNFLDYTMYPTISMVSTKDARTYRVEAVSKDELVQRIETLETEIARFESEKAEVSHLRQVEQEIKHLKQVEAEVERLKQVEQRMVAMEAMLAQLATGAIPSQPAVIKGTKATEAVASTSKKQVSKVLKLKKGDTFFFGKYQKKPIEWNVLDVISGRALLLSRWGLNVKTYNDVWTEITWEKCTLRKWLKYEFYENAFSAEEQYRIQSVLLANAKNLDYETVGDNKVLDRVFLLSIDDAQKYFDDDSARKCLATEYAKEIGASVDERTGTCFWWLRSPGSYGSNTAVVVSTDGSIGFIGDGVTTSGNVVRPAIWISLES